VRIGSTRHSPSLTGRAHRPAVPVPRRRQLGFGENKESDAAGGFVFLAAGTAMMIGALLAGAPGFAGLACLMMLLGFGSITLGGHGWAGIALMIESRPEQPKRIANLALIVSVPPLALGALTAWLFRYGSGWSIAVQLVMITQALLLFGSVFAALRYVIAEHSFPFDLPFAFVPIQARVDASALDTAMHTLAGLSPGRRAEEFRHRVLLAAAKSGNADTVAKLLAAGAPVQWQASGLAVSPFGGLLPASPLAEAAAKGHVDVVKLLLARGADANAVRAHEQSPLHRAAEGNHAETVRALLSCGANIAAEWEGKIPLILALQQVARDSAAALIAGGANINAPNQAGKPAIHQLMDVLHYVAREPAQRAVALFASLGGDINARDEKGASALHHVLRWYSPGDKLDALLDAGATVDARDGDGRTPLHLAQFRAGASDTPVSDRPGLQQAILILVVAGADCDAADKSGRTPRMIAAQRGS